jgi:hypothetical protein
VGFLVATEANLPGAAKWLVVTEANLPGAAKLTVAAKLPVVALPGV